MQNNGKGLSVAGLVLGICALVIGLIINSAVGLVCGIVGIILSVMGRKKAKLAGAPTGMATAGLVLGICQIVAAAIQFFQIVFDLIGSGDSRSCMLNYCYRYHRSSILGSYHLR